MTSNLKEVVLNPPSAFLQFKWLPNSIGTRFGKVLLLLAVLKGMSLPMLHAEEQQPVPKDVTALSADYKSEFAKAKDPIDKLLRAEGSKLAASFIKRDEVNEARVIGEAIEQKLAGKTVFNAHPDLKILLERYDTALANTTEPLREKYGRKVDELIQKYAGKDMGAVLALGDVKKAMERQALPASPPSIQSAPPPAQTMPTERNRSAPSKLALSGQTWEGRFGKFSFQDEGAGIKTAINGSQFKFKWKVLSEDKIDYVEISDNGSHMNHRIWTFDELERSAEVIDPADVRIRNTVRKTE